MTDLILPISLASELDAVNACITSMGELPVTTLSPSPTPDVDKALICLQEMNRQVQSAGWKWNEEIAFRIAPDLVTSQIILPNGTLEVTAAYYIPGYLQANSYSSSDGIPLDVVARGQALYDRLNHTFTFTQPVFLDITLMLSWDQLPEKARRVITLEAVQLYQSRDQMSAPTMQVNAKVLGKAWELLEQGEDVQANHNQIYGNLDTVGKLMGNRGMRRNRVN